MTLLQRYRETVSEFGGSKGAEEEKYVGRDSHSALFHKTFKLILKEISRRKIFGSILVSKADCNNTAKKDNK